MKGGEPLRARGEMMMKKPVQLAFVALFFTSCFAFAGCSEEEVVATSSLDEEGGETPIGEGQGVPGLPLPNERRPA